MTISSAFTINGALPTDAVAVAAGSTVSLALLSTTGAAGIQWSIVGNDRRVRVSPTVVSAGSPFGAIASFVMPTDAGDGLGQAYRLRCTISDGKSPPQTVTSEAIIGVANPMGVVPLTQGEELARHAVYGWTETINLALATAIASNYAASAGSIPAVAAAPGWNVIGTFPVTKTRPVSLDVIGSVSDLSLTMTAQFYCVTPGSVGVVTGSTATIASLTDVETASGSAVLQSGRLYQIQEQIVGNAGDSYFGNVRRAAPTGA